MPKIWESNKWNEILIQTDDGRFLIVDETLTLSRQQASEWLDYNGHDAGEIVSTPPINAYVVAVDETDHYKIDWEDRPYIDKIVGVYLFDRNWRSGELAPNYRLIHLCDQVRTTPAAEKLSDFAKNCLCDKYEHRGAGEDIYVYCPTIDQLVDTNNEPFVVYHHGHTEVDLEKVEYNDQMEALREHYCSNGVF